MKFTNDGLSLWYGTSDAPSPDDDGLVPRSGARLIVGMQPAHPLNTVSVRYNVDGGPERIVAGYQLRTDYDRAIQYFAVPFPDFVTGECVEYSVVGGCSGRQVPAAQQAWRTPSRFRLAERQTDRRSPKRPSPTPEAPDSQRFVARLSPVAGVDVSFDPPEFVGDTADGVRINFFVCEGTVLGAGFAGKVTAGSSDHLLLRPDGMGVIRIRASFVLDDGAILDVESGGYVSFGPAAYESAKRGALPDRSELVVTPLISTRDKRYRWLSRIQCLGVGETHLDARRASYQVFSVANDSLAQQSRP